VGLDLPLWIRDSIVLYEVRSSASHPHPNLEDQGFPLIWVFTFDLHDMGGPSSGYATVSIVVRTILPRKSHHYVKVGLPSVGIILIKNNKQMN